MERQATDPPSVPSQVMSGGGRLAGLDLFRGAAVAGMIVVNSAGSWGHVWWPLDHAAWHGFTPTDLVFPAFLFAMGVALGLSFPRPLDAADRRLLWWRIVRRTLALVALGIAISIVARWSFTGIRFLGVLQRIGLCYFMAGSLAVLTARRDATGRACLNMIALAAVAAIILLTYWVALTFAPVPGFGAGRLDPAGNLPAWIDRQVLTTSHMWRGGKDAAGNILYDPEGLLSTLPALTNVLFGILAAATWKRAPDRAIAQILIAGIVFALVGALLHPIIPLNKRLWTSSFAILTTGLSAILLVLSMNAGRTQRVVTALRPLTMLGMNAILGYLISIALNIIGNWRMIPGLDGAFIKPQEWGFGIMHALVPDPYLASFLCSLVILAVCLAAIYPFHRRGIHLRL